MVQQQSKNSRKRKALLVLPLLTIPFLTLAFWALGGGKGIVDKKEADGGLNMHLPDPQLKASKGQDKLSFYREAEKDNLQNKEQAGMDLSFESPEMLSPPAGRAIFDPTPYSQGGDSAEAKVYRKIAQLQRQLQVDAAPSQTLDDPARTTSPSYLPVERANPPISKAVAPEDPQLAQLNSMMDKILDIQHPERIKERYTTVQAPVTTGVSNLQWDKKSLSISCLAFAGAKDTTDMASFFFSTENEVDGTADNTIEAVIHGTQALKNGSLVKLRLLEDIAIGNNLIPSGTFLFGRATQQQERLRVTIGTIRHQQAVYPLQLALYDMDGLEGIHLVGPTSGGEPGRVAEQSIQQLGLSSLDPSLKAQVAAAGIQTARNLLSRKVKQQQVVLKSGYRVLLKEQKKGSIHH